MNNTIDEEVREYFQSIGYTCDWDRQDGIYYHEIYKDGELVAQIDKDIPLSAIKMDLIHIRDVDPNKGISEYDYSINGDGELFDEMLSKIEL